MRQLQAEKEQLLAEQEMKEILTIVKQQQEQISKLTQALLALQSASKPSPSASGRFQHRFSGPVICWRCHRPGHLARRCDAIAPVNQQTCVRERSHARTPLPVTVLPTAYVRRQTVTQTAQSAFLKRSNIELAALQTADSAIGALLHFWQEQRMPGRMEKQGLPSETLGLLTQWNSLTLEDGIMYRVYRRPDGGGKVLQLLLPECLREEVFHQLHHIHDQQGTERTIDLIRQRCYWPGMGQTIKKWCQQCDRCGLQKDSQPLARAPNQHQVLSLPKQGGCVYMAVPPPGVSNRRRQMEDEEDGELYLIVGPACSTGPWPDHVSAVDTPSSGPSAMLSLLAPVHPQVVVRRSNIRANIPILIIYQ